VLQKLFDYVAAEHPELFVLQVPPGLILTTGVADKILESVKGFPGDEGKFECVPLLPI
jgi:hypothetical protein